MGVSAADHLLPGEYVARMLAQSREDFVTHGDHLFLVAIPDATGELAQGLTEASTVGGSRAQPSTDSLGYGTITRDIRDLRADSGKLLIERDLRRVVLSGLFFIAPLRKRPTHGKPFAERISVGRARNNDIVLRQADVSKFHAWLECDDMGRFYLGDANSKNATKRNGVQVGRQPVQLHSGDEVYIGSVRILYCDAATLWQLAQKP